MPWIKYRAYRVGNIGNSGTGRVVIAFQHTETNNVDELTVYKTTTGAGTASAFLTSAQTQAQARLAALRAADDTVDITDQISAP